MSGENVYVKCIRAACLCMLASCENRPMEQHGLSRTNIGWDKLIGYQNDTEPRSKEDQSHVY